MGNGIVYPPGLITPLGSAMIQSGYHANVSYVGWEGTTFNIMGGFAPQMDYQNGLVLRQIAGLQAPARFLDNQGARQDGITYLDSVREPAQIDMVLEAWGASPEDFRATVRAWIGAWRFDQVGIMYWQTNRIGEWWMPLRQAKPIPDQIKQYPAMHRRQIFTWTARGDNSFWLGPDSVAAFQTGSGGGFNAVTNLGTEPAWPRHLVYGPGTFTIGDGTTGSLITFGPLTAGQVALITTLPRLRSVVDLSAGAPQAAVGPIKALVQAMVNYATRSNTPPLLQFFESLFGVLPQQGPMYSLLNGRFTQPIAGKLEGVGPVMSYIPVAISGGNGNSKIITAITPQRTYPE